MDEFYLQPPTVGMMNIIGSLSTSINLELLYTNFIIDETIVGVQFKQAETGFISPIKKNKKNPSTKRFYNQITLYIKHQNKHFKVKIFNSGQIHIPGCKTLNDAEFIITILADKIEEIAENNDDICNMLEVIPIIFNHNMMITMQYKLNLRGQLIDRTRLLLSICNRYKTFALFSPDRYPGIKVHFFAPNDTKHVTIIIQASGIIAMKGSNSMAKNMLAHDFINPIILEHIRENQRNIALAPVDAIP